MQEKLKHIVESINGSANNIYIGTKKLVVASSYMIPKVLGFKSKVANIAKYYKEYKHVLSNKIK